ncbi:hypothetical protein ACQZV8_01645 [Magnetococcales bacterium HHB-1]
MSTTLETPIRVGDLPEALRGGFHPDVVVEVSLKPVLTENGFTPEEEEEILQAAEEAEQSPSMSKEAFLAKLDQWTYGD